MPLVNFANLDFDQIKTTLKNYLKANSNFTDYDFEGSNLSTILDVLAYNTYITSYNANMVANEVFIDSATLRENVVSLARNIGYVPKSRKAATATVSFFVDTSSITPPPVSLTLHKGSIASTSGSFGNQSFVFSILQDITVPVFNNIASFDDVKIYEGVLLTNNFTYSPRNPNQKYVLPNSGIDTDLISTIVRPNETSTISVKYNLQDSLFNVNSESEVYYIQEIEDERYELIFGDGTFGKALEDGNYIQVSYILSNGDGGNGVSQFTFSGRLSYTRNSNTYTITSGISLLTTILISSGGESIEPVESIRKFAPRIYASQNRALTSNDYETLIPSKIYPETESISVFGGEELIPPQYGKVFISIKPRTGDFLPNLIKENIKLKLKQYAVAGIVPEILDLKYLYLEVISNIYYNSNLAPSSSNVSSIVQSNTLKYAESTELNKYGARFKYSKFLKIIDDSHDAVTSNITKIQMRRDLRVVLNSFAEYSIGFGNQFHISSMNGYNIKSTAFTVSGISGQVYISDVPDTNRSTGSIFIFSVPNVSSANPTIVKRGIGRIDYIKGIITLNPINITSAKIKDGQSIIEISVVPQSNDVIGLQDLYLQLDINNSIFEMVIDSISSGSDPAASNYIQSSSYLNGILVRPTNNIGEDSSYQNNNLSTSSNTQYSGSSSSSSSSSSPSLPSSSSSSSSPSSPSSPSSSSSSY